MPDHFQTIYARHADRYDALVSREDYHGNILKMLENIRPLAGLEVVEFGAGTGRLTRLLAPLVKSIRAFDASRHMLDVAEKTLKKIGAANWTLQVGDNRQLPAESQSADMAIEGWSFGHLVGWHPENWRGEIGQALAEMRRVLRPGGTAVLLETLGTGRETPQPPGDELAAFYRWLETEQGFSSTSIRTDYQFESLDEAVRLTRFFFGDAVARMVKRRSWVILPECTGVWWRTF